VSTKKSKVESILGRRALFSPVTAESRFNPTELEAALPEYASRVCSQRSDQKGSASTYRTSTARQL
jgi:hypothetical protein